MNRPWPVFRLEELCERITVGWVGPMASEYVHDGVPFLRSQNIQPFQIDARDLKFIPESFHRRIRKSELREGDVAVVRTGYPGTAAVIPSWLESANCADLVIIRPGEKLNSVFLAALFNSTWGKASVEGRLVGSAQQHFNIGAAKRMELQLPPLASQLKIASVLSAYQTLIDNNRRRIQILEEIARRIYREWFVDMRYPNYESVLKSDSRLEPIPKGWEASSLGDVTVNFDRQRRPLSGIERGTRPGAYPYYGAARVVDYIDAYLFDGTYVLVAEDGSVITPEGLPVLQYVNGPFWANNHTHVLQGRSVTTEYLYLVLSNQPIGGFVTGAAQPKITQANLNRIDCIVPSSEVLQRFDGFVTPLFGLIVGLRRATALLRATRDLLLPLLVLGEIDVQALDIAIEAPAA